MNEKEQIYNLEIRSTKGRFELSASSDRTINDLQARVAELMQEAEPSLIRLIHGAKSAPAEGTLADFLTSSRTAAADPMGLKNFIIYALHDSSLPRPPETPETAAEAAAAREQVLSLMPSHIRKDLQEGSDKFQYLVDCWQKKMLEDPEATRRQLESAEMRNLLDCLRAPRPPRTDEVAPASMPLIGQISADVLHNNSFLQEMIRQPQQQLENSNQQLGILRDIKFYHDMMQQSMRLPEPPRPAEQRQQQPDKKQSQSTPPSAEGAAEAAKAQNPRTAEALKKARESLQLLRQEAPELLPDLMREVGIDKLLATGSSSQQQLLQPQQTQQSVQQDQNPLAQLAQLSGLLEQLQAGLGGGGDTDDSQKLSQLREMGFTDDMASRLALQVTNGDVNAAADILSQQAN